MIRELIADDHAIVREGLKQVVNESGDIEIADEASNGNDALNLARRNDYDVVILDITMPGRSGLDVLAQLKDEKPEVPVLVLSIHPEEQYAIRTLKTGAAGYLTKESAPQELVQAIRKVANGGKYVTNSLAEKLAFSLFTGIEHEAPHESLSAREFEVLRMLAEGHTLSDIARILSLSVKTISTYRSRILEKMNLKNNAEIVRYALEKGLVS